jgi:myo-inositol-1(or 4)-monophosphatase
LQEGQTTRVAVVHDPVAGETFSAVAGAGAMLGREPLRVSATARVEEALVGLSFNPSPATKRRMAEVLAVLLPSVGDVRRLPAAIDLVWVAAGRLDAAVVVDTRLWDVAAGLLIAAESGAAVGTVPGAGADVILVATPALGPGLSRLIPGAA